MTSVIPRGRRWLTAFRAARTIENMLDLLVPRSKAIVRAIAFSLIAFGCMAPACGSSDNGGPWCPSSTPLQCPNLVCCPSGHPYLCNGSCYAAPTPCNGNYLTCKLPGDVAEAPDASGPTSYDGTYRGNVSGTKTVTGFGSSSVTAALVLTVAKNQLVTSSFDGMAVATPASISDSIPGISHMVTWSVPGGANQCAFHMTGTFRTDTALGKTASGTFTYDAASGCTGGGTWQANAN